MKKMTKKAKASSKKVKPASKARSKKAVSARSGAMKATAKKASTKKSPKKTSKKLNNESRDAQHNMLLEQSREFMIEHGQQPKRKLSKAKATKAVERAVKPAAIPIRQPQLHSES